MASKPMIAGVPLADMSAPGTQRVVRHAASPSMGQSVPFEIGADNRRAALLARALESEVIPRLVLARQGQAATPPAAEVAGRGPAIEDVEALTRMASQGQVTEALALIARLRGRDVPIERIYLELLAPVARRLGEMWAEDRCDFASVTVGLCCLQQLLLETGVASRPRHGRRDAERRILLAPVPGEQHSFGLLMVGEMFRRQGWDACCDIGATPRDLLAMVHEQWFDVVGFSLSCESQLEALATLIRKIRRAARNPCLGIMVGGRIFAERPELGALVGADATAGDGPHALALAEGLLALLAQQA